MSFDFLARLCRAAISEDGEQGLFARIYLQHERLIASRARRCDHGALVEELLLAQRRGVEPVEAILHRAQAEQRSEMRRQDRETRYAESLPRAAYIESLYALEQATRSLSKAQQDLLREVALGKTSKEIAASQGKSPAATRKEIERARTVLRGLHAQET